MERFTPANIHQGDRFRVRQTFYASGVPVRSGQLLRVDSVETHVEERIYRLSIHLTPLDPPGGTIIWERTQPLDQTYLDEIMQREEGAG